MNVLATSYILPLPVLVPQLTAANTIVAITTSTTSSTSSVSALHTTTTKPFVIKFTDRPIYLHDSYHFFLLKFVCIHFVFNTFDLIENEEHLFITDNSAAINNNRHHCRCHYLHNQKHLFGKCPSYHHHKPICHQIH
jgi:hypothetical protein